MAFSLYFTIPISRVLGMAMGEVAIKRLVGVIIQEAREISKVAISRVMWMGEVAIKRLSGVVVQEAREISKVAVVGIVEGATMVGGIGSGMMPSPIG